MEAGCCCSGGVVVVCEGDGRDCNGMVSDGSGAGGDGWWLLR